MNAVDTRPNNVTREKIVVNQQVPLRKWPLAAPEGARGVGEPPVQLVDEDGVEVADNLGGVKREAIAG